MQYLRIQKVHYLQIQEISYLQIQSVLFANAESNFFKILWEVFNILRNGKYYNYYFYWFVFLFLIINYTGTHKKFRMPKFRLANSFVFGSLNSNSGSVFKSWLSFFSNLKKYIFQVYFVLRFCKFWKIDPRFVIRDSNYP